MNLDLSFKQEEVQLRGTDVINAGLTADEWWTSLREQDGDEWNRRSRDHTLLGDPYLYEQQGVLEQPLAVVE